MKYLIQSILVAVTLLTVSCNDYLDRFPKDSFSEPTFFKTENDLIYYANQFYGSLPVQRMDNDNNSDNMVPQNINTFLAGTYTVPGSGGGWASGDWANTIQERRPRSKNGMPEKFVSSGLCSIGIKSLISVMCRYFSKRWMTTRKSCTVRGKNGRK